MPRHDPRRRRCSRATTGSRLQTALPRPRADRPVTARGANRRIRLLLLGRRDRVRGAASAGRSGCRASRPASLERLGDVAEHGDRLAPRRAAGRSSTARACRWRWARRRRRSTPTRSACATPTPRRWRPPGAPGPEPHTLIGKSLDRPQDALRLHRAAGRSGARRRGSRSASSCRARLLRGGAARLPAARHRLARHRLRRRRQRRPRRPRAPVRPASSRAAPGRRRSSATRPAAPSTPSTTSRRERAATSTSALDRIIQENLQEVLADTRARWSASSATGIVLDPRNGRVLAMAVEPGVRRRTTSAARRPDVTRNRAVTDTYEPGSTFKIVAGLGGAVRGARHAARTRSRSPPVIQVADRVDPRDDRTGRRTMMSVAHIVAYSSNVGAVTLAELVSPEALLPAGSALRLRPPDRARLPRRDAGDRRAAEGQVVGLVDRQPADRPGHRRDALQMAVRLRRDRERGRLDAAAPRHQASTAGKAVPPEDSGGSCRRASRTRCWPMLQDVVVHRRQRRQGGASRATRSAGKTGTAAEAGRGRATRNEVRRVVRRHRPGDGAARSSSSSRSTSRTATSTAAPSRRRRSRRSPASTCSTSASRLTPRNRGEPTVPPCGVSVHVVLRGRAARAPVGVVGRIVGDAGESPTSHTAPRTPSRPGALFICRARRHAPTGMTSRRRRLDRGAVRWPSTTSSTLAVPQLVVPRHARRDGAARASPSSRDPSAELDVVGVTGTSGKTTTTFPRPRDPRGGRTPPGPAGHDREPRRRRAASRPCARRRSPSTSSGRCARWSTPATAPVAIEATSHGSEQQPARRRPLRRARLHEPRPRPPRLPRHDRALLRGEAAAVRTPGRPPPVNVGDEWGRRLAGGSAGAPSSSPSASPTTPTCVPSGSSCPRRARRSRRAGSRSTRACRGRFNVENALWRRSRSPGSSAWTTTRSSPGSPASTGCPGRFEAGRRGPAVHGRRRLLAQAGRARERARDGAGARHRPRDLRLRRGRRPRPREASGDGRDRRAISPTSPSSPPTTRAARTRRRSPTRSPPVRLAS